MPLDRHAKRILDMIAGTSPDRGVATDPLELRRDMLRLARLLDARDIPIGAVENRCIPGAAGPLSIRIYTPRDGSRSASPGLIYFHGGMGVFGDLETHDGLCRILSNSGACRVVAVDYRLAPEHPFPAGIEDCYVTTRWVVEHSGQLGLDPSRIAVGGDSHGGTLAAIVCQLMLKAVGPAIALQLLLCPVLDLSATTASRAAFAVGYFFDASLLRWAVSQYCPASEELEDPRISPLRAPDLSRLPPAHIHTAEFDPMRDEGEAYAKALERNGVEVSYLCHPGMIHHFYSMAGVIPYAHQALESAGVAIRQALDRTEDRSPRAQRGAKNSI